MISQLFFLIHAHRNIPSVNLAIIEIDPALTNEPTPVPLVYSKRETPRPFIPPSRQAKIMTKDHLAYRRDYSQRQP